MTAATLDLDIECGADFSQALILKDDTDTPLNLTGYSFASMIKISAADESALTSFTCTVDPNPLLGTVTLSLTNAQTIALFAPGNNPTETTNLVYDLVQTVASVKSRIIQGNITLIPGVTL